MAGRRALGQYLKELKVLLLRVSDSSCDDYTEKFGTEAFSLYVFNLAE